MSQQGAQTIFNSFSRKRILVIGDLMIDSYLWGSVNRISPEAPVPIVDVKNREIRLGGAANVALNLSSLGATPVLCGLRGLDKEGEDLVDLMKEQQLTTEGVIASVDRVTTIKHRIIAQDQHLLRVDQETASAPNSVEASKIKRKISELISDVDAVVFEDYDKGALNEDIIQYTIQLCLQKNIPTVVDPKKRNFYSYKGATLFKPNLKEMAEGLKRDIDKKNLKDITKSVEDLRKILGVEKALVTLSELGMIISNEHQSHHESAHKRNITDVSGAGDTVVSVAALALIAGLPDHQIAALSNLAGGLVCEQVGVVPIENSLLFQEAIEKRIFEA